MKKPPIILFFIRSSVPTEEEQKAAEDLGVPVKFRNAEFAATSGAPEECDGVAGVEYTNADKEKVSTIPEIYSETYPDAEKVIAAYKANKPFPKKKVVTVDSGETEAKGKAAGWTAGK